jgi:hypothetical protein
MRPLLISLTVIAAACGEIDPPPPVDEEGEEIPLPGPLEPWLGLRLIPPPGDTSPLNPTFIIEADTYLDDDAVLSFAGGQISSGGLAIGGTMRHVFTQRRLYWTPARPLIDGLEYRVTFALGDLRSVNDAPPLPPDQLTALRIADGAASPEPLPPELLEAPTWPEVEAIFTARCNSCHGQPAWPHLTPMTRQALVNTRDPRTDRPLVRPFDPADSYLLHKLLPDYPNLRGTQQPPPWSPDPAPLSPAQLLKIERWIAAGAPP